MMLIFCYTIDYYISRRVISCKTYVKEVQAKAVEILVYIDNICRSNNLHYTLFYGTLIGVERHKVLFLGMMILI